MLARPFHLAQKSVRISASIGISRYPHDAGTPIALLQAADQAMYEAKRSGSNRMCFYVR
ncbi:MAG TPA: diguanylate cyclase [Saccharospirillum sp.]|nr:diguanylate cyclase [Saccharospirillum sp.]